MALDGKKWKGTTYGGARMHRWLVALLRVIDIRVVYAIMSFAVVPWTLVLSRGARLTYRYFRLRRNMGGARALWATYKNHCLFGETVIDKFAMYAGHKFRLELHGFEEYERMNERPEALVQLSAHIGCMEILGYSYHSKKVCNILAYGGEKEELMSLRQKAFAQENKRIIPVGAGGSPSAEITTALERGEIVCVFADRLMNEERATTSTIHGHGVRLARGPFSMAVNYGANVMVLNAMKKDAKTYAAYATRLDYDRSLSGKEQRKQLADGYTREIERLLEMYPIQWFNYYDLWTK